MSVTDPLIKEIKACTAKFLGSIKEAPIDDSNVHLVIFCSALEKIFELGLNRSQKTLGFVRYNEPWLWMKQMVEVNNSIIVFGYKSSVEKIQHFRAVQSNVGKFRLLVRFCLVYKCLHVPVEYLLHIKNRDKLYQDNSIIGDEILCQILLSVLLQCGKIRFNLDLANASFLDFTWRIPQLMKLELVPCDTLGLGVSFSEGKAVIVNLKRNSVITESGKVHVGDILDSLNNVHICSATKGRLSSILQSNKGKPITLNIIKSIYEDTGEFFPPVVKMLKDVRLDPISIKKKYLDRDKEQEEVRNDNTKKSGSSAGFKVTYVGYVEVGKFGDMKQIDKASRLLMSPFRGINSDGSTLKSKRIKQKVYFEIGEIGLKVLNSQTSELLLKHSYMEISSCGAVFGMKNHFAYIAGDEYCNKASNFICYVFSAKTDEDACTILQSIGQGFQRTHYVV